jgi:hypothetical protein
MRNWATRALLAVLLVGALPVMATPPRTIEVRDRLFARNAETLFLIREIRDNHGLHGVTQTDTLLVFRNLAGGDDRGFQGVARVVDLGPDAEQRAVVLPLSSRINPYDLFADFDAWPLNAPRYGDPSAVSLSGDGLALDGFGFSGPARYALSLEELNQRMRDTLIASLQVLPPHTVGGGSIGPNPFDPAAIDILRDCEISNNMVPRHADSDPALVQLTCEIEDGLGGVQLWLVVPQV